MLPYLNTDIPRVAICNIAETFFGFLNRAEDQESRQALIYGEQYRGDRALLWLGNPKLVFVSFSIPHADYLLTQFGYDDTHYLAPQNPTPWLCTDILQEPALLARLIDYANPAGFIQLIPYATTPQYFQLVHTLETEHHLRVLSPESPIESDFWLRDYMDTKQGFRSLTARWLPNAAEILPEGIVCHTSAQVATVAMWFCQRQQSCLLKADDGENGIGNQIIVPSTGLSSETIQHQIEANSFLRDVPIMVEQLIPSSTLISPSLEIFVPSSDLGEPQITYLSEQIFEEFGDFCGVLVSRESLTTDWYPVLQESGRLIAAGLQAMGYIGHFDLDAIVDDQGRLYLLEVNTRRTGGTHVHEFAYHYFGPNYLDKVTLLSHDSLKSGAIRQVEDLLDTIGNLLYPIGQKNRGVIVTVTSALEVGEFGCIIVDDNTAGVLALQEALLAHIGQANALR